MQSNYPIQIPNSPAGLQLRQTITSSGSVTVSSGTSMVYAIIIGGAAASGALTGAVNQGWTIPATTCVIGTSSGTSSYGTLFTGPVLAYNSMTAFTGFTGAGTSGAGALLLYY